MKYECPHCLMSIPKEIIVAWGAAILGARGGMKSRCTLTSEDAKRMVGIREKNRKARAGGKVLDGKRARQLNPNLLK